MSVINSNWVDSNKVIWRRKDEFLVLNGIVEDYYYEGLSGPVHDYQITGSLSDAQFLYFISQALADRVFDLKKYAVVHSLERLQEYLSTISPIDFYHPNFLRFTVYKEDDFSQVKFRFDEDKNYFVLKAKDDELWVPEELGHTYLINPDNSDELINAKRLSFSTTALELIFMTETDIQTNVQATTKVIEGFIQAFNNSGADVRDFESFKSICALIM